MFKEIVQLKAHNSRNRIAESRKGEGVSINPLHAPAKTGNSNSNWANLSSRLQIHMYIRESGRAAAESPAFGDEASGPEEISRRSRRHCDACQVPGSRSRITIKY